MYICSRLKRGPGTEARLLAALSVECRVHYLKKKDCFLCNEGDFSVCGYKHDCPKSHYQVSHHSYCGAEVQGSNE